MSVLRRVTAVAAPRERVFALLEDARGSAAFLPEFLAVEVVEAPWIPRPGSHIRRKVRHRGVGFELETELGEYRRGHFLLERQVAGPFARFEHAVHVEDADGGCRVTEVLAYAVRLGLLGRAFDRLALRRDLETALAARAFRLVELTSAG